MQTEQFIKNDLAKYIDGKTEKALELAEGLIDDVLHRYRSHDYLDLIIMLDDARTNIAEQTQIIDFLMMGGTISQFAKKINRTYAVARIKLIKSDFAKADKSHRPYWWTLCR